MKKENKDTIFSNHNYATLKKSYMAGLNYYDDLTNEIAREDAQEFDSDFYRENVASNEAPQTGAKVQGAKTLGAKTQGAKKKECTCDKEVRAKKVKK